MLTEREINNINEEETKTYHLSNCNVETTQNAPKFFTILENNFF